MGFVEEEKLYQQKYDALLAKIRAEYVTPSGRVASHTATAYALALYYNIIPEQFRKNAAKILNDIVLSFHSRVVTGFIGTPHLLFALSDNGYHDTARRLLTNRLFPGWLYSVDMGATTVWERWNSLLPDGTPNPEGMNSYNHYAYGSVMEFIYRRIVGIENVGLGFDKVRIAPIPTKGFPQVRLEFDSPHGKIISAYTQKEGKIQYQIVIPQGVDAEIVLQGEGVVASGSGTFTFERECEELYLPRFGPEQHVSEVFDDEKAVQAFNQVFGGIFTGTEIAWMKNDKTLQFMAEFRDMEGKDTLAAFPAKLKKANKIYEELLKQ